MSLQAMFALVGQGFEGLSVAALHDFIVPRDSTESGSETNVRRHRSKDGT